MILLENLCNGSPSFSAFVIQEDTSSPLPVGCLTYGLTNLTGQYRVMITPGYRLILLLSSTGGPALPRCPFRLGVSYQAYMETSLLEVHPPGDPLWISFALRKPNVFVRMTWARTRGTSEFQLLSITSLHSVVSMDVKRHPTAPEGVAYQLAD